MEPAFVEGWGLYAASLGEELGLYRDAEAKFGWVSAQTLCAAGLVIDTGMHAQGWTRKQALEYLRAQIPVDDAVAEEAVDRVVALPGEALACTVGFSRFKRCGPWHSRTSGSRFELRAFHAAMLKDGALPLDELESRLKRWMSEVLSRPAAGEFQGAAAASMN